MKWSLKIGRIAGIDLYMHATFLILIVWIAASGFLGHQTMSALLGSIGFILLLFVIIILHELGHALAARKYGIETKDITLLPIGGVARLDRIPEEPLKELVVAIAGPLVNLVIAAGIFVGISVTYGPAHILSTGLENGDLMTRLLWVNVWLAFFNLLPAFPMDGGRVLRALLAIRLDRPRATEIAVSVGHVMALLFGAVGIWLVNNPFLVFIAFFIWIGADGELQQVRVQSFLHGIPVSDVMARKFDSLASTARLSEVAKSLVPGFQSDYPVFEDEKLIGFIGLADVVRGLAESGADGQAGTYAQSDFETASPSQFLEDVVGDWRPGGAPPIAVIEGGRLVGIVTPTNVAEHVMVRSALSRSPRPVSPGPAV